MAKLIQDHPGILRRPIWFITSTVDAEELSNNAWEEKNKQFDVGIEAGNSLAGLKVPLRHHVSSSIGAGLSSPNWQSFIS